MKTGSKLGCYRQGFELLLPYKSLALVTGPYKGTYISKKDWPIVPCPQDLVGCGLPIMMAPTCVRMKVMHDLILFFFI